MRHLSNIASRMFAVDFEDRPGGLGTTAVVLADSPSAALEKAFRFFPEYRRAARRGLVSEAEYAEIDWDTGRVFVIHAKERRPKLSHAPRGANTREKGQG